MANIKTSYEIDELKNINLNVSKEEIFKNLNDENCDDFLKIFSIINIDKIIDVEQSHIFLFHLTNHSNPLREAVALKLEELFFSDSFQFFDETNKKQLLKALIDINPNICRVICSIIASCENLQKELNEPILLQIEESILKIKNYQEENKDYFDDKIKNKKNHAKNKILFSLYWLLEAFSYCVDEKYNSRVLEILNFSMKFCDYTIREKTAKIISRIDYAPNELLQIAKNDQNFYVKNQVYDKINFED